ncbi:MAG: efflux RND transporter periplasmic adaptor subunit [Pseudomonadota bacterium]
MTDTARPPLWRSAMRRLFILVGTACVAVIAIGLLNAGTRLIEARASNGIAADPIPPMPVAVIPVVPSDSYSVRADYLGVVEPRRETTLGFEAGGTLAEVLVDEGDTVTEDDVIARLDIRELEAERAAQLAAKDALIAQRDLAVLTAERQARLASQNFSSQQRSDEARFAVAELEARIAQSDASISRLDIAIDKAVIRAPFDGRVGSRSADEGQRLSPGQVVVKLLEKSAPRLRVGLPADVAREIVEKGSVDVDVGTQTLTATFEGIRSDIDPLTRTVAVLFTLDVPEDRLPPFGQVARLSHLRDIAGTGTWLPLTALSEGERGLWTVFFVDDAEAPAIAREAVELIYADAERAYVRGALPAGSLVVASGVHRLTVGQSVEPVTE